MPTIRLPAEGWRPRAYQLPVWSYLENGGKRAECIWHRRSGKDEVALHWAAVAAFERPATYWHMLPEAAQGRRAIWEAVNPHSGKRRIDEAFPHALRETTRENEMMIRFKSGSALHVVGSDNFNSLVGSPPAGVVFSEWALADPAAWGLPPPDPRREQRLGAVHHHAARQQPRQDHARRGARTIRPGSRGAAGHRHRGLHARAARGSRSANTWRSSASTRAARSTSRNTSARSRPRCSAPSTPRS